MKPRTCLSRAGILAAGMIACRAISLTAAATDSPPELVTDRPDQTESSKTVPVGSFQLESGWTLSRDDEGGDD